MLLQHHNHICQKQKQTASLARLRLEYLQLSVPSYVNLSIALAQDLCFIVSDLNRTTCTSENELLLKSAKRLLETCSLKDLPSDACLLYSSDVESIIKILSPENT